MAIGRIIPALEVGLALLGEGSTRFHQVFLVPMLVQLGGEALEIWRHARTHLPHHVDGVDTRDAGGNVSMCSAISMAVGNSWSGSTRRFRNPTS